MNIRKNMDYTDMYEALDSAMEKNLSQVELYYEIGRAVCQRTEKGAAVAAAAYLSEQYPNIQGFSPRNLRRMRDFYRAYEDHPDLLTLALQLGWTQNVVILEAGLTMELREWYIKASKEFGWSKAELIDKIETNAHEMIVLKADEKVRDIGEKEEAISHKGFGDLSSKESKSRYLFQRVRWQMKSMRGNRRRCSRIILPKSLWSRSSRQSGNLQLYWSRGVCIISAKTLPAKHRYLSLEC